MNEMQKLSLEQLENIIQDKTKQNIHESYTQKMLAKGSTACVRKFAEEAIELVIAVTEQNNDRKNNIIHETADLLYHLLLVLRVNNIELEDIQIILAKRNKSKNIKTGKLPAQNI